MTADSVTEFLSLVESADGAEIFIKLVLSKASDNKTKKIVISPRTHKENKLYTTENFTSDGKVLQRNFDTLGLAVSSIDTNAFSQMDLIFSGGDCSLMKSKKGKINVIGKGKLELAIEKGKAVEPKPLEHKKQYLLCGNEPFLFELDITDKSGRIKDKRQAKYRQICRFLEYVKDMLAYLPKDKIVIYDLCCGKSYLSFAVYHYFKNVLGYEVYMLCVDLKADVMRFCSDTAKKLGYDGMHFEAADINALSPDTPPDLVLSLHACDTATDIVLQNAVRLGAKVILSTPCCHRDLSRRIKCEPLSFALKHSILKSKLCDALTDSLRLLYLECEGYKVDACELVDPEDTPKNVILRATKRSSYDKNSAKGQEKIAEYNAIRNFLGI